MWRRCRESRALPSREGASENSLTKRPRFRSGPTHALAVNGIVLIFCFAVAKRADAERRVRVMFKDWQKTGSHAPSAEKKLECGLCDVSQDLAII